MFEIALSHLFFIIFSKNKLTLVILQECAVTPPPPLQKIALNFIRWMETVSYDG